MRRLRWDVAKDIRRVKELKDILRRSTGVDIKIGEGVIEMQGDAFKEFMAEKVLRAMLFGFSYEDAVKLLDNMIMEVIDLDIPNARRRHQILGRLIGREGKVKKRLEEVTGTHIMIRPWAVAILGPLDEVEIARRAVEKIIRGAPHEAVFAFLHRWEKLRGAPRG